MTVRRKNKRDALLALLADGQVHTHQECMAVGGSRFGGRLYELRREPYSLVVETIRLGEDNYGYKLIPREGQGQLC